MSNEFFLDALVMHHKACEDMSKLGLIDIYCPTKNGDVVLLSEETFKELFKDYSVADCGRIYDEYTAIYKGVEFKCLSKF